MNDLAKGVEVSSSNRSQSSCRHIREEKEPDSQMVIRSEIIPSIKVESIDSTGAGDAFVGATLYQLAKNQSSFRRF